MAGPIARRHRIEIDHDAHVGGRRTVLGGEHGVQIHLGDLGKIRDQQRHVFDDARERFAVDRVRAAHPFEDRRCRDTVLHRQRVLARRGRQPERDVLEHFDQHAAQTKSHELAERRIGYRADDDFLSAREHLLHLNAEQVGLGVVLLRVGHDRVEALLDFVGTLHADEHAARFGLVEDLRGNDLQDDGKAHPGRELGGVGGRRCDTFLRDGNAIRVADELAFRCGQRRAPFGLHLVQNPPDFGLVVRHDLSLDIERDGARRASPTATLRIALQITFSACSAAMVSLS